METVQSVSPSIHPWLGYTLVVELKIKSGDQISTKLQSIEEVLHRFIFYIH